MVNHHVCAQYVLYHIWRVGIQVCGAQLRPSLFFARVFVQHTHTHMAPGSDQSVWALRSVCSGLITSWRRWIVLKVNNSSFTSMNSPPESWMFQGVHESTATLSADVQEAVLTFIKPNVPWCNFVSIYLQALHSLYFSWAQKRNEFHYCVKKASKYLQFPQKLQSWTMGDERIC